jgi:hypothetical protein
MLCFEISELFQIVADEVAIPRKLPTLTKY